MTATPPTRIDRLHIGRGDDAFTGLTQDQRLRLIVRVLCGLVAYDEVDTTTDPAAETLLDEVVDDVRDELTDRLAS